MTLVALLDSLVNDYLRERSVDATSKACAMAEQQALVQLYAETIRQGLFSHEHYMRLVIGSTKLDASRPLISLRKVCSFTHLPSTQMRAVTAART